MRLKNKIVCGMAMLTGLLFLCPDVLADQVLSDSNINRKTENISSQKNQEVSKTQLVKKQLAPHKNEKHGATGESLTVDHSQGIERYYTAEITHTGYTIDTKPWGESGFQSAGVGTSADYLNQVVTIRYENESGYYANIWKNNQELGWIDKRAFKGFVLPSYQDTVVAKGYSFDSKPWGEDDFKTLDWSNQHLNEAVTLVMESENRAYVLALQKGESLGWLDKRAFVQVDDHNFEATSVTPYHAKIVNKGYSIDTKPWGVPGFQLSASGYSDQHLGEQVVVSQVDESDSYVLISDQYFNEWGWLDRRALLEERLTSRQLEVSPQVSQRWWYCVPASLSMILDTVGVQVDQFTLARQTNCIDYVGTESPDAIKVLNQYVIGKEAPEPGEMGYHLEKVTEYTPMSSQFSEFKLNYIKSIQAGKPVYLTFNFDKMYDKGGQNFDHAVVGIGYVANESETDIERILYRDPSVSLSGHIHSVTPEKYFASMPGDESCYAYFS